MKTYSAATQSTSIEKHFASLILSLSICAAFSVIDTRNSSNEQKILNSKYKHRIYQYDQYVCSTTNSSGTFLSPPIWRTSIMHIPHFQKKKKKCSPSAHLVQSKLQSYTAYKRHPDEVTHLFVETLTMNHQIIILLNTTKAHAI